MDGLYRGCRSIHSAWLPVKMIEKRISKMQCQGIAASTGERCHRPTSHTSGCCKYHRPGASPPEPSSAPPQPSTVNPPAEPIEPATSALCLRCKKRDGGSRWLGYCGWCARSGEVKRLLTSISTEAQKSERKVEIETKEPKVEEKGEKEEKEKEKPPPESEDKPGAATDAIMCSVCLDSSTTKNPDVKLACGHGLCYDCAQRLRTMGCPTCRVPLKTEKGSRLKPSEIAAIETRHRDDIRAEQTRLGELTAALLHRDMATNQLVIDAFLHFLGERRAARDPQAPRGRGRGRRGRGNH